MSESTIIALFRIVDGHEWHELPSVFHSDVMYERPGYSLFCGLTELSTFYRHTRVLAAGRHVLEGIVSDGCVGASWGEFIGVTHEGTPVRERFADVYRFDEGKIIQRRSHFFRAAV